MVDNIKNMKNELELLSDNEKQKKQDLIDTEVRKLQDFDKEAKEGLQRERDDMVREILKEIDAVIKDYASKNGFTLVLNNRVLVYAEEQYDITKEILNILNSKYRRKK
jgi:outer membrane protein